VIDNLLQRVKRFRVDAGRPAPMHNAVKDFEGTSLLTAFKACNLFQARALLCQRLTMSERGVLLSVDRESHIMFHTPAVTIAVHAALAV
jgi:hypothetical protein